MSISNHKPVYDVVIIGGGPAGMSAALVVGRARLNTVVLNAETPRNSVTTASHGFLTRDGAHPTELLAVAKKQLRKYGTVQYVHGSVTDVRKNGETFEVKSSDGTQITTERVIVSTGYRDDLTRLELPGIEDVYGKSVYPCPFCDGFEHRDERLAVFGGPGVENFVQVVRVWSEDIVVFTNGRPLTEDAKQNLERRGVVVAEEAVSRLLSTNGVLSAVTLETGQSIEREAGFIADDFSSPASTFAKSLGVNHTRNDWGMEVPDADTFGQTNVEGLYVVGDAKSGFSGLIASANEGAACAESIVHEIAASRWMSADQIQ